MRFAFLFTPCNLAEALRAHRPPSQTRICGGNHSRAPGGTALWLCLLEPPVAPRGSQQCGQEHPSPDSLLRSHSQTAVRESGRLFPRWSGSCRPGSQGRPAVSLDGTSHPSPPPCCEPGPHWFSRSILGAEGVSVHSHCYLQRPSPYWGFPRSTCFIQLNCPPEMWGSLSQSTQKEVGLGHGLHTPSPLTARPLPLAMASCTGCVPNLPDGQLNLPAEQ